MKIQVAPVWSSVICFFEKWQKINPKLLFLGHLAKSIKTKSKKENCRDYEIILEDGVSVLKFRKVIPEDEGEYVCEAYNDIARKSSTCFVKVQGRPRFFLAHITPLLILIKLTALGKSSTPSVFFAA